MSIEYRMKVYVGPIAVGNYADRLRKDGRFRDILEGTEHIHFTADTADGWENALGIECDISEAFGYKVPTYAFSVISHNGSLRSNPMAFVGAF